MRKRFIQSAALMGIIISGDGLVVASGPEQKIPDLIKDLSTLRNCRIKNQAIIEVLPQKKSYFV